MNVEAGLDDEPGTELVVVVVVATLDAGGVLELECTLRLVLELVEGVDRLLDGEDMLGVDAKVFSVAVIEGEGLVITADDPDDDQENVIEATGADVPEQLPNAGLQPVPQKAEPEPHRPEELQQSPKPDPPQVYPSSDDGPHDPSGVMLVLVVG